MKVLTIWPPTYKKYKDKVCTQQRNFKVVQNCFLFHPSCNPKTLLLVLQPIIVMFYFSFLSKSHLPPTYLPLSLSLSLSLSLTHTHTHTHTHTNQHTYGIVLS